MTDQTIPADEVREIVEKMYHHANHDNVRGGEEEYVRFFARQFDELLPAPPRPTLADMTPDERAACQWMQADVPEVSPDQTCIITRISPGGATVLDPDGVAYRWFALDSVTPRPDLPRMEWPGDQKPEPEPAPTLPDGWRLADHQKYGRVIVTNHTPNRDGYVYIVLPIDDPMGYDWHFCDPDDLTYLDQGADTSDAVPESTLAVGSEWHDADALTRACEETGRDQITATDRDGDVYVWDANLHDWRDLHPIPNYAPYTIIHAGKKADQ